MWTDIIVICLTCLEIGMFIGIIIKEDNKNKENLKQE